MGKPLSMDLRSRALAAVDEGMSCRAAARRFAAGPCLRERAATARQHTESRPHDPAFSGVGGAGTG